MQTSDPMAAVESGRFDAKWYGSYYRDVGLLGIDPTEYHLWVGCGISYKYLWESAFVAGAEYLIVMEDDALLPPTITPRSWTSSGITSTPGADSATFFPGSSQICTNRRTS